MSQQQKVVLGQKLKLFDACDPLISSGEHFNIEVEQQLSDGDGALLATNGLAGQRIHVQVEGPQLRLSDDAVLGKYPAADSEDSPAQFLPHITLARRTLPWERHGPTVNAPWLALLLLTESELRRAGARPGQWTRSAPVSELRTTPGYGTDFAADAAADTSVELVDVPRSLLPTLLPTLNELALLCHMRQLTSNSPIAALDDDGDVALVLCNRLPDPSAGTADVHHALLVSLERRGDLYPMQPQSRFERQGQAIDVQPAAPATTLVIGSGRVPGGRPSLVELSVPLLVLQHWSFRPSGNDDFESVAKNIRCSPRGGVLRFGNLTGRTGNRFDTITDAHGELDEPLEHPQAPSQQARFRGPLSPSAPPKRSNGFALRAAPEELTGVGTGAPPDYSHAAAFELGRLLALADPGILQDLQQLRPVFSNPFEIPIEVDKLPQVLRRYDQLSNPNPAERWDLGTGNVRKNVLDLSTLQQGRGDPAGIEQPLQGIGGVTALRQRLDQMSGVSVPAGGALNAVTINEHELKQRFSHLVNAAREQDQ